MSDYGPNEQLLLRSFKEAGLTSLAPFLASVILPAFEAAISGQDAIIAPVPSSRANYIKRGYVPTKILAKQVNLRASDRTKVISTIQFTRLVEDQSGLSLAERKTNLAGAMAADSRVAGRKILLFDDVVTTGATLLEAARAVSSAGGEVIGFVTFSETILKTAPKS